MIRLLTICCFLLSAAINCPAAATISEADRQILRSFWEYAEKQQLSNLSVEKRVADPWYTGDFETTWRDVDGAAARC